MIHGEEGDLHVIGSIASGQLWKNAGCDAMVGWREMEVNKIMRASSTEINLAVELALQVVKLCHKYWSCPRC